MSRQTLSSGRLNRGRVAFRAAVGACALLLLAACGAQGDAGSGLGSDEGARSDGLDTAAQHSGGALQTRRVRVSGPRIGEQKLAYWDTGREAPAIVFVHSNSCAKECWERQFAETLPDGSANPLREYRLIAFDLPGHGQTRRLDGDSNVYSIALYAEALSEFSRALGLHDAVYVGHSLGGHALIEAGQLLESPAGALIYGTPPISTLEQLNAAFFPTPGGPHFLTADLTARDIHHWEAAGFYSEIPDWFARAVRRTDKRARGELPASFGVLADEVGMVRDYPCPIAIIQGEFERSVRLSYLTSLNLDAELWRGGIQIIPESNHFVSYDQSALFNSRVVELADEVTAP